MLAWKTILTLVNALDFQTHDEVGRFCIEFDLEHVRSNATYIKQKETAISKHLIANKDAKGPMAHPWFWKWSSIYLKQNLTRVTGITSFPII